MKNRTHIYLLIVVLLAATGAAAQMKPSSVPSIPHLEKRGNATQLVVDGQPYLVLGAELANSASSNLEYMQPYWPRLVAANVNTVLPAVSWELIEPEPGRFDFSSVDELIRDARKHGLRLMLLWFGSWKNSVSTYVPMWVKKDTKRFPLLVDENGKNLPMLSVFSEASCEADSNAFAALMRHVREVDGQAHTVIMVQVENEVGIRGALRDHLPEANKALNGPVPKELVDYMVKNRDSLVPEFREQWEEAGGRTSGTWAEVFGKGRRADNIFMAWHYAQYMGKVAKAGKAEYPLPMFVNAALGDEVGQYSSGGPLADVINVWQAGAPSIDILTPCTYRPVFAEWVALYNRSGNPLFIPESRPDPGQVFYAIGRHALIGFSPFAFERTANAEAPLAQAYDVLDQLAPLILEAQAKGTITSVSLSQDTPSDTVQLGGYNFEFEQRRSRVPTTPPTGQPGAQQGTAASAQGGTPATGPGFMGLPLTSSYGLVISTGPDEFIIAGAGIQITFPPVASEPRTVAIGTLEEGQYVQDRWVAGRQLNGDDITLNYDLVTLASQNLSGQGLRFGSTPSIVHLTLYRY